MVKGSEFIHCWLSVFLLSFVLFLNTGELVARDKWQQRVNYELDVTLNETARSINGTAEITYVNNSPDTLACIWFRLPAASLRADSKVDNTPQRSYPDYLDKVPEWHWGNSTIDSTWSLNREVEFFQDGSIGYLELETPLLPSDSAEFTFRFTTKFPIGKARSRIGWMNGQFKGAYWYPMVAPYNAEFGWTVNRYYGTAEGYGEFGNFNIKYHVPNKYIVASTGILLNESQVLPPERLEKLSFENPSEEMNPISPDAKRMVTWNYYAENVPDVAFVMDPSFLIERIDYDHYEAWAFARRGREKDWHDAAEICGWTIGQLEEIYGPYPWKRVVATDSWSAMEYPQLTMMCSASPRYTYVMIHEVIHNYTPMILHSSSVDEIWIDEGFTTFIEHELTRRWFDSKWNRERSYQRGPFTKKYMVCDDVLRGKRPYLESVLDNEAIDMTSGADPAKDYSLLRVSSYYKTPIMFNALRYVIGEETFWEGMQIFYTNNKLSHVSAIDVREAFEEAHRSSLRWFFKQFVTSSEDIDYSIKKVVQNGNKLEIKIKRRGGVKLPLRVKIVFDNDDTKIGEIPFLPTDKNIYGFNRWGSWDQIHEPGNEYQFTVNVSDGRKIKHVYLGDPDLLTDRNPLDNHYPDCPVGSSFDLGVKALPPYPIDSYRMTYGPTAGYNIKQKLMPGLSLNGSYMGKEDKFSLDVLFPVLDKEENPHYRMAFKFPVSRHFGRTEWVNHFGDMNGDRWYESGISRSWRSWGSLYKKATVQGRMGSWESLKDDSYLYVSDEYKKEYGAVAYLSLKVELESSLYTRNNWRQKFHFVEELSKSNAFVFEWSLKNRKRIYRLWTGLVESRVVYNGSNLDDRFYSDIYSSMSYNNLGHTLFGGIWNKRDGNLNIPQIEADGVMTSYQSAKEINSFGILRFSSYRPLPYLFKNTPIKVLNNTLDKIGVGFFESNAIFSERGNNEINWAVEGGVEAGIYDIYGVSIVARIAPFYYWDFSNTTISSQTAKWNGENWGEHLILYVSVNADRFFR